MTDLENRCESIELEMLHRTFLLSGPKENPLQNELTHKSWTTNPTKKVNFLSKLGAQFKQKVVNDYLKGGGYLRG
ncbi:hypothetical protein ICN19_00295 [Polynucleobacter sp. AP-Capit-er-40B-B4]|uniref:hypothetical protein n=1 Tax=Polynucleobacter sp. AP-Capit-er-40B-B4 TaxID=2576927 RepID=UPI001C0C3DC2|nr:hypothetical protein [Polynucleobacter sp. AP-Capit-er-40B-B4]MBU3580449.1 hypothetical protein [Polynucleobacter sp. AP-Capit-er-40B-B4]